MVLTGKVTGEEEHQEEDNQERDVCLQDSCEQKLQVEEVYYDEN